MLEYQKTEVKLLMYHLISDTDNPFMGFLLYLFVSEAGIWQGESPIFPSMTKFERGVMFHLSFN